MTYKSYIKKDYKTTSFGGARPVKSKPVTLSLLSLVFLCSVFYISKQTFTPPPEIPQAVASNTTSQQPLTQAIKLPALEDIELAAEVDHAPPVEEKKEKWKTIEVKYGENLSIIFDRLQLSPSVLYKIVNVSTHTKMLKELMPGQKLHFQFKEKELSALKYEPDLVRTLLVTKDENGLAAELQIAELEKHIKETEATIENSLFLAGQRAGLSDKLIMEMVGIYGWDIDFVLDIRKGDQFKLIYEESYKDGLKVDEGPILAAEFINRGDSLKSVRYTPESGRTDYYSDTGASMRKAFLRTPLKFSRISSRFSLNRKHPILNRIRSHKGVDYAAATGTPIKATGDGTIIHRGNKGGYGKTVVIRHGGKYSTLYAHMSRYARGIKNGKRVKQGQVIGYVGSTGLATGPHLHYEFRLNGVHRNPLTVKLPKADGISKKEMARFRAETHSLLAQLDDSSAKDKSYTQASSANADEPTLLAMQGNQPKTAKTN